MGLIVLWIVNFIVSIIIIGYYKEKESINFVISFFVCFIGFFDGKRCVKK